MWGLVPKAKEINYKKEKPDGIILNLGIHTQNKSSVDNLLPVWVSPHCGYIPAPTSTLHIVEGIDDKNRH